MSRATYGITTERETDVARLLRRHWPQLRDAWSAQRLCYAVGALVCDRHGNVRRSRLVAAIDDDTVAARATALLAIIRWQHDPNDGAYDPARRG